MARFFNPNQGPLDFGYGPTGGGGGRSIPSDPLAGEKYKRKESARLFNEAQIPITPPPGAGQSQYSGQADISGRGAIQEGVQEGIQAAQPQQTRFDPELYATALDKSYGVEAGNQYRAQQLKLDYETQQTNLENFRMGAMLISAGRKKEGLDLINSAAPPDQQIKDVQVGSGGMFRSIGANGNIEEGNINDVITSLVSSKDLFNAQQQYRLSLLSKTSAKTPLELKTDEVVAPNGQVFSTPAILEVYKQTYGAIKQLADDPRAMLTLKATDPGRHAQILAEAAGIPTPMEWAKKVYGVDITGKSPGRTMPAPQAGGKTGAKTPKSEGWMDTMPDAAQYRGNRIKSSTGQVLISDGTSWLPEEEFKKKYGKK